VYRTGGRSQGADLESEAMEAKRRWSCGDDLTRGVWPQSLCARGVKFASMLANNWSDCVDDGNFAMNCGVEKLSVLAEIARRLNGRVFLPL
jgi:hypothetical protein